MKLKDLLTNLSVEEVRGPLEVEICGVEEDSRRIRPGVLFVARKGLRTDGHRFIPEAVRRGAAAVVREDALESSLPIPQIRVKDSAEALGYLLASLHGHPERKLRLVGITGTNGKSSVAWMLYQALTRLEGGCGLVGTLIYHTGSRTLKALETTPPPGRLYALLAEMVEQGLQTAVLEVSSHALDQKRVAGLNFQVGVFTNLSRDHLDYHGDLESYFASKRRLFTHHLSPEGLAVLNVKDPWGRRLKEELGPQWSLLVLGEEFSAEIISREKGLYLKVRDPEGECEVQTALYGDFQKENFLLAWAVLRGLGFSLSEVKEALSGAMAPPGRLEPVVRVRGAWVFVDYAHTPEALRTALESARRLCQGRLLCLFGCGGNRDQGKRPLMGRVAAEMADELFITSDNPRFEDPMAIIRDIVSGLNGRTPYHILPDRREALAEALRRLSPGDVLLVAGKGHEDYQEIRGERKPFSDREEIRRLTHALS